ncbi:MAG: acyl transferase [Bacteroidetes bacterium]|nr:acyl transferase [Bacteroidota bacterium]
MAPGFTKKNFAAGTAFTNLAVEIFLNQYSNNAVYKDWCDLVKKNPGDIEQASQIPFLPISFFKSHTIITGNREYDLIFESSGTTQTSKSRHYVKDVQLYVQSFIKGFEMFYGDIKKWCIIGLLPSYLQQKNSSLIKMVNELIRISSHESSGFYLDEYEKLTGVLNKLEQQHQKTLLIGVTYALLDFAECYPIQLSSTIVMETGGMKGRRKEITRQEVHEILQTQFGLKQVHSEYGMTELLSQAYSKDGGKFFCPPWMKVMVRDEDDPLLVKQKGKGALNVIDLANINSCSFIATDDVGEVFEDGSFSVSGRLDGSDIRGCSLMVV